MSEPVYTVTSFCIALMLLMLWGVIFILIPVMLVGRRRRVWLLMRSLMLESQPVRDRWRPSKYSLLDFVGGVLRLVLLD
jgi:hypothetical protein